MLMGMREREDAARNQPRPYAHHGYIYVLLNFRGLDLTREKIKVPYRT